MNEYCMKCMMPLNGKSVCLNCGSAGPGSNAPHQLPPGKVLRERYLVGRVIGQGGFGITYIGRDLTLGMRVAIKEYYPTGYANRNSEKSDSITISDERNAAFIRDGKARFLGEARVLAQFYGTPGIVNVANFFDDNGTAYIVMEYLDGEDLRRRLGRGLLSADQAFELMRPVMDALEKVHAQGVVHRDISPDNVMVLKDGTAKLMDFGAARLIDYSDQRSVSVMLKAGYAPEEQYRARGEQGAWTDVYALCATIYKAITGVTPDDALQRVYEDETVWPSEMGIAITLQQEEALRKGMAPRAVDRFRSIGELKAALGLDAGLVAPVDEIPLEEPQNLEEVPPGYSGDELEEGIAVQGASLEGISVALAGSGPADGGGDGMEGLPNPDDAGDDGEGEEVTVVKTRRLKDESEIEKEDVPPNPEPDSPESPGPLPPPKGKLLIAAVAIAAVLVAAALVWLLVPSSFTVQFDTGEGSPIESAEVARGDELAEPEAPTLKNYTFEGWYYDQELTERVEFPVKVTKELELHAAWEEILVKYTVKYLKDGTDEAVQDAKVVEGNSIGAKVTEKAPSIDGYQLVSDESQSLKTRASEKKNVITFNYRKKVSYTVNYLDQGSGAALAEQKVVGDVLEGDTVAEEAPSVDGYNLVSESPQSMTLGGNSEENVITFYYTVIVYQAPVQTSGSSKKSGSGSNKIHWDGGWD